MLQDAIHREPRVRPPGDRSARARQVMALLAALLVLSALWSLGWGASEVSVIDVIRHWFSPGGTVGLAERDRIIVEQIRLPRVVTGILIGASLAVSGAVMQGLFRNPLADPAIVGVSSGSGLGAVTVIVLGGALVTAVPGGQFLLPLAAFLGGLIATMALYRIATRQGRTSVATMLLAGIALGALANAATGLLIFIANDQQLRDLTFWGLGSLAGASWVKIASAGPVMIAALVLAMVLARPLNALSLGEAAASHLGISVQRMKNIAVIVIAAATGAAVAISGGIGFVGIVVPHLLRLAIGPDHRYLLPASALLGAVFLTLADALSRTLVAPAELPIGIVTAAIGAPFFLWLLLQRRELFIA